MAMDRRVGDVDFTGMTMYRTGMYLKRPLLPFASDAG